MTHRDSYTFACHRVMRCHVQLSATVAAYLKPHPLARLAPLLHRAAVGVARTEGAALKPSQPWWRASPNATSVLELFMKQQELIERADKGVASPKNYDTGICICY